MKKKILFIDDDPTILLISEIMLEALGYDVITADGGVSGIELLKTNIIDLVLLDLMIPDIYGLDVLKYIKEKEEFKNILKGALYVQNEEQDQSGLWKKITEEQYIEQARKKNDNTDNAT